MNKSNLIYNSCLLLIIALLFLSCSDRKEDSIFTPTDIPEGTKTNVLLIIGDDIGADIFPGYAIGTQKPNLPNLERLAKQGIQFDNVWAYSNGPPTRASILTGKYGHQTGVIDPSGTHSYIMGNEVSLHKNLTSQSNGDYKNALIGKWDLSLPGHTIAISATGIDYYIGTLGSPTNYYQWDLTQRTNQIAYQIAESTYVTKKLTDLAIDWIQKQNSPWFCWLAYASAHKPFHLPPDSMHHQGSLSENPATILQNPQPYFFAMMEAMDTEIGRLLKNIPDSILKHTTIIFVGDNGTDSQAVQTPYTEKGGKGSLHQGGLHVPMIISGAWVKRIGEKDSSLIHTMDLFPTILQLTGNLGSSPPGSFSFKPLLQEPGTSQRKYNYSEKGSIDGPAGYTIRDARYKLIEYVDSTKKFYDLEKDPYEKRNLLSQELHDTLMVRLETLQKKAKKIQTPN